MVPWLSYPANSGAGQRYLAQSEPLKMVKWMSERLKQPQKVSTSL